MTDYAGVLRPADGLGSASRALAEMAVTRSDAPGPDAWEATNLATVATAIVAAASVREETRGSHWRELEADAEVTADGAEAAAVP